MNLKNNIYIHRGNYSYKYPENSIPAFQETIKNGQNIELDVHILKDNTVVVFHDDNLKRMCNVDKTLKDLTYKELSNYKLLDSVYNIPTLKNILQLVRGKVILDIELKYDVANHQLENEVIKMLKDYKGKVLLKSFDFRIVRYLKKLIKKHNLDIPIGILLSNKNNTLFNLFSFMKSKADFICFDYRNINKFPFNILHKRKPTLLYTIKDNKTINNFKSNEFGFIIENYDKIFLD